MRRIFLGSTLVLHGLAHAAIGMAAQDGAARSHAGAAEPKLIIASAAFATAMGGFVAAGFGVLGVGGLAPRWRGLTALAVMASATLLAAYPRSLAEALPAIALDALALAAVAATRRQPNADATTTTTTTTTTARPPKHPLIRGAAFAAAWSFLLYVALVIVARPWQRSWGSNDDERQRPLPGDEHADSPRRAGDRAIAIRAPARDVWPWVAQIGQDRGGFYSIVPLERLFGVHVRNADRIEPAWQTPRTGDFVRATQDDWLGGIFGDHIGWEVDHVLPGRLLALRYWIFEVQPTDAHGARLHVRTHAGDAPVPIAPLLLLAFEPAHFVMERAMLLGIRERAEEHAAAAGHDDDDALLTLDAQ
jgi:hypothetical protein